MGEAQSELLFPVAGYARPCDRQPLHPPTVPTPGNRRARLRGTTRRRHDRRGGHGARDPERGSKSRQAALESAGRRVRTRLDDALPPNGPRAGACPARQSRAKSADGDRLRSPTRAESRWSLVFFGRRDPGAGLVVIVLLWAAIVATIAEFWRTRRLAGVLLLPYLAWVTFATILNAEIWRLNE